MDDIRFDTYYRYDDLTGFLRRWSEQYAHICRLESLGQSYEGRDIWILTLTNFASGPDTEKPAYWVDGNIHATEVSASTAALYLIDKLLRCYGDDPKATYALDTRVFYVVPRLNPDGAEWALAERPKYIRSSTRPYPRTDTLDGLHDEDLDGDGRILQMRVKDPNGAWKVYPADPRLMIPREPDEPPGGDYYRVLTEGLIQNYDGVTIKMAPRVHSLDLNRQFPSLWEPTQPGAGPYPTSEPEARAAADFIVAHPNITGSLSLHTFGGILLRPPNRGGDESIPLQDASTYAKIGRKGSELTGYPSAVMFTDYRYNPRETIKGTFDDWMYENRGLYAWICEIWSPQQQAGITDFKVLDWFREHPHEDDLALLKWNDEVLDGRGYVDWYPFDHPQLGPVELGGWDYMYTWRNPPPALLEKEIAPLADFALYCGLLSPRLELHSVQTRSTGTVHHIQVVFHNTGWLPTNITQKAVESRAVREVEVDIRLPEGARLITGQPKTMLGQLSGRDDKWTFFNFGDDETTERARVEWVIEAEPGTEIDVTAVHERAGVVRETIRLG